ncbi:MAG: SDR family oxidoreductase [Desulfobacteraceae bacterium]|nr:SDR family oxidoreductase [Desulfobacteraceae bacterium]
MKNFNNKNAFVPGGSTGIGFAIAKKLASLGADVIIFARGKEKLEQAVKELSQYCKEGQKVSFMQLDVSENLEVNRVMNQAVNSFGVPDILINCAGRAMPDHFEDIRYEQFDETMKINLYGTWNVVFCLVPHMKKNGGYIVNVASIAGFVGIFGYTDYCASKYGIIGFSEALKSKLKKYNIMVSVLCPPDTDTPGFELENATKPEETKAISAHAKLLTTEKVAGFLIKAIKKKKFMIIPGFDGKLTFLIKRLFPGVVEFIMNLTIKKVERKKRSDE